MALLAAPPPAAAQTSPQARQDGIDPATRFARADSLRAALAEVRPPNSHPTDVADVVTVPLKVIGAPINLVLVQIPSWVIGALSLPRPPGFFVRTLRDLRQAGVHPAIRTSIGPRSGPAAAVRLEALDPLQLDAAYSSRGSQRYWAGAGFEMGSLKILAETGWRSDAQIGFYGVGPDSPDERTLFRHDAFEFGLGGELHRAPLRLHADVGYENNLVREPSGGGDPSLFEAFDPAELFGATGRQQYVRFGGGADFDFTRRTEFQDRGVRLLARATRYEGVDGTESAFHKIRLEGHGLAPLNARQLLALRARTDLTRGGTGEIPFYHLAALGGEETAIGFPDTRFRDRDMVSLTAEWRYEIWRDIHNNRRVETFLYFGEGAVGRRLGDIASEDWRTSYGVGARFARRADLLGMMYLGFSDESVRFGVSGEWTP